MEIVLVSLGPCCIVGVKHSLSPCVLQKEVKNDEANTKKKKKKKGCELL